MGLEVRGVEDDSADDQGNEEQPADNDDWATGTEKHEPVLLRSFLCRLDCVWMLFLAAITLSLFFYASLIFGN